MLVCLGVTMPSRRPASYRLAASVLETGALLAHHSSTVMWILENVATHKVSMMSDFSRGRRGLVQLLPAPHKDSEADMVVAGLVARREIALAVVLASALADGSIVGPGLILPAARWAALGREAASIQVVVSWARFRHLFRRLTTSSCSG